MPCYHPITAWQTEDGQVVFAERGSIRRELTLPCGQCIGCRLERSRQWAVRCTHEASLHPFNSFVTLTYSNDHLPYPPTLIYDHYQRFMKRLRKQTDGNVRFFMCGEYGDQLGRPHYHACLFNVFFNDRVHLMSLPSGSNLYRSPSLERLWPFGFSSIGDVTFESAAYVARYVTKKVTGPNADEHYTRIDPITGEIYKLTPEFARMSLKPGIGAAWFHRFRSDAYSDTGEHLHVRGMPCKPPRYYDNLLKSADDFQSDYIEYLRYQEAFKRGNADNTRERLAAREAVVKARLTFKKRSLL